MQIENLVNRACRCAGKLLTALFITLSGSASHGALVTIFDNTYQPTSGYESVYNTIYSGVKQVGQGFNTDEYWYELERITLIPGLASDPGARGIDSGAVLDIYENGLGGSYLLTSLPLGRDGFTAPGLQLRPKSVYFVVLNSANESAWAWTSFSEGVGIGFVPTLVLGGDFRTSTGRAITWPLVASGYPLAGAPMMMQVLAQRLPEPSTGSLLIAAGTLALMSGLRNRAQTAPACII
ncbi:MAG: hypothetical protein H6950_06250 [Zoogloeaceae bacterium]|nr:hypothetical protein [Zoogloeaceae bacterium]